MNFEFFNPQRLFFPFHTKYEFSLENHFILGRLSDTGCPPSPSNILTDIPKGATILYDIFSVECTLTSLGNFSVRKISETDALKLHPNAPMYEDEYSKTGYKRYMSDGKQHTIWIEDYYHVRKKLSLLEKMEISDIHFLVTDFSYPTLLKLVHTDRYSI